MAGQRQFKVECIIQHNPGPELKVRGADRCRESTDPPQSTLCSLLKGPIHFIALKKPNLLMGLGFGETSDGRLLSSVFCLLPAEWRLKVH